MINSRLSFALRLILLPCLLLLLAIPAGAEDSTFRIEFITNYKTFKFKAQEKLIQKSGDIMADEIFGLIIDSMDDELSLGKRMFLLDAASAMAHGYDHYHGGGKKFIKKIDKLIKKELAKEAERNAELMAWKKEERFLGNFVMKAHEKEMNEAGLAPVIYPHWVHRIWYECSVCHQELFVMKRWRNEISHEKITAGKQCGACHDGTIAFGADEKDNCERCHLAGKPEAKKLHNADHLDHENISKVAARVGAEWHADKLPDGRMPVDKYGFIDWLALKRDGIFQPLESLNGDYKPEPLDDQILFISKSKLANVLFSHDIHSSWIRCNSCHPAVFEETLTNKIKMVRMSKGENCGYCHGKVSFTFADCKRCHNQEKGVEVEGALTHIGQPRKKK
ncbi:hypothetical protein MNBD_GAMMA26-2034 [hydrothermal vent metagenome]|uniref:Cytochrome c7-like domain-containing protein n=1 Tax=hydrothermal vent metagenome TaxID=652676 RepID=A0A3B1BJL0_9ZZZZ